MSSNDEVDVSQIAGNVSDNTKQFLGNPAAFFQNRRPGDGSGPIFGESIQQRLKVTEISVHKKAESDGKKSEGRVVVEIDVAEDMLNGGGNIHGGCSAFLVDICSTLALCALTLESSGELHPSVSQSLNLIYHSPAQTGDKLRLVNTTLSVGARAHSARTEIWNVTHGRLVVTGTHIKMIPSLPKANL